MRLKQNWSFRAKAEQLSVNSDQKLSGHCQLVTRFGDESNQVPEGCLADALALRGDEGRGTLR